MTKNLEQALVQLGFSRLLGASRPVTKTVLAQASIRALHALMSKDHRAKGVPPRAITRYATAVLSGAVRGVSIGHTPVLARHPKLKAFLDALIPSFFLTSGNTLKNMDQFQKVFRVKLPVDRVTLADVRRNPTAEKLLKYTMQTRSLISFKTPHNLKRLREATNDQLKGILAPQGAFNPKYPETALQYAIPLVRLYARTNSNVERMKIASLVHQLRQTTTLGNGPLLTNIRRLSG